MWTRYISAGVTAAGGRSPARHNVQIRAVIELYPNQRAVR